MNPTLLLVDDEPAITDAIENSLLDEHYTIFKASCAAEALSVLELHPITVVIADQEMPGMSGLDLCATVHRKWPTTYRILLSSINDGELEPASKNGDIHQYLSKPWDSMLLRYNINEGIRQQGILEQALKIRSSFQQSDQACFITDKNWVIQIASASAADWLGCTNEQLNGKNLFSRLISNNSIEDETHLITTLENQAHWQGSFHLNTESIHGSEAWMSIVPFAEQHYLCLAMPMIDDMLNKLSSEAHINRTAQNVANISPNKAFRYLSISVNHKEKLHLDLITLINERLQLASDNLYQIIASVSGNHIIQLPNSLDKSHIDNLLAAIHQAFIEPIHFQGKEQFIDWSAEEVSDNYLITDKAEQPSAKEPVQLDSEDTTKRMNYQGHSYYQPHHYKHTGFSCLPIFNQHGQAIGLMPPSCPHRDDVEQWQQDALNCSQEWQNYSELPINWVNDFSNLKPHQLLKALAAIVTLTRQKSQYQYKWTLILSAHQLHDIQQAEDSIQTQLEKLEVSLMIKNPDYHLNTIKELHHHLPRLFAGLCIDSHWLFDSRQKIKRHSMQLLNHLKNSDLLIWATDINSPEQLAIMHTSPCHWLAGEILSVKLLPQQISWLHQ